jgi:hypothetical protein
VTFYGDASVLLGVGFRGNVLDRPQSRTIMRRASKGCAPPPCRHPSSP